jgi:hypothetical protein
MTQLRRDLKLDWVLDSSDLLKSLAAALPPASLDTAALVEALCPHGSQRRDLGFGLALVQGKQGAGYLSADVRIADFEGQAAILRIDLRGDTVRDLILETWPHDLDRQRLRYETRDPALWEAVSGALASNLGHCPPPEVDPAQEEAYETLMDPLLEHHYGTACYIAGTPPKARSAIEALVASAQYELVRSILRSPNPEARVYAVEALKRWERKGQAIHEADRGGIDFLASQETPIFICAGCMVYPEPQDVLLARLEDVGEPQIFGTLP